MKFIKKIQFGFWLIILSLAMPACYDHSPPRPDKIGSSEIALKATKLPPYSTPPCTLAINTINSDFPNFVFNIDDSKIDKDTIVFLEKTKPQNNIKIIFDRIIEQDGVYIITYPDNYTFYHLVSVIISGNKLGTPNLKKTLGNGQLYFKQIGGGYDLVLCGSSFENPFNTFKTVYFNAHFVILK